MARLAAPGAMVVQDLRRTADEAAAQALWEHHGADLDRLVAHDYLHSLRAAFTHQEVRAQVAEAGMERGCSHRG